jgi:hypothetical protein
MLATKGEPSLEGPEWEKIFAYAIGAEWKPSNIGLDDVQLKNCAWGAKTVKATNPWYAKNVRLICGRNSPVYSYGATSIGPDVPPEEIGQEVINIWNARVDSIRSKFAHARQVVLVKSNDLLRLTIFETELLRYACDQYRWSWNKNGNLEGHKAGKHYFTWQPHGSQFTVKEDIPENKLCLELHKPESISLEESLKSIGFQESWVREVAP